MPLLRNKLIEKLIAAVPEYLAHRLHLLVSGAACSTLIFPLIIIILVLLLMLLGLCFLLPFAVIVRFL